MYNEFSQFCSSNQKWHFCRDWVRAWHDFQHTPPILQAATIPPSIQRVFTQSENLPGQERAWVRKEEWLTDARLGEDWNIPLWRWSWKNSKTTLVHKRTQQPWGYTPELKAVEDYLKKTQHTVVCLLIWKKNQCYAQGANQQCQPGSTALKIMHLRYRANTKAKTWAALTAWEKVGSLF